MEALEINTDTFFNKGGFNKKPPFISLVFMNYFFLLTFLSMFCACQNKPQEAHDEEMAKADSMPYPNFDIGKPYKKVNEPPKPKPRVPSQDTATYYTDFDIYQMKPAGNAMKGEVYERCVSYVVKKDSVILEIYPTGNLGNVHERLYTKEKYYWKCIYEISDSGWISQIVEFVDNKRALGFIYDMDYPTKPRLTGIKEVSRFAFSGIIMIKRENLAPQYYEDGIDDLYRKYNRPVNPNYKNIEELGNGSAKIYRVGTERIIKDYSHFWDIYLNLWKM